MNIFGNEEEDFPSERLLNAASLGRADQLIGAIRDGGDVNHLRLDIAPTLICAMRQYSECLEILMQSGASASIPNRMGWTALHEAAQKEDPTCLQLILNNPDTTRLTALDHQGTSALIAALEYKRFDNAELLAKAEPRLLPSVDLEGSNSVMWAVRKRDAESLEWLLKKGVSAEDTNEKGISAQHEIGDWEEGKALIEKFGYIAKERIAEEKAQLASPQEEEVAPSNPFGLGDMRKKKTV